MSTFSLVLLCIISACVAGIVLAVIDEWLQR